MGRCRVRHVWPHHGVPPTAASQSATIRPRQYSAAAGPAIVGSHRRLLRSLRAALEWQRHDDGTLGNGGDHSLTLLSYIIKQGPSLRALTLCYCNFWSLDPGKKS